ncbi:hypothetical protein R1flu_011448 [Riccia fluitans]|uniref:Uncharacterized protein n=1 Tax=Riccia fluitans TaxID=41844 RepID=A0ABD1Z885_9MARC
MDVVVVSGAVEPVVQFIVWCWDCDSRRHWHGRVISDDRFDLLKPCDASVPLIVRDAVVRSILLAKSVLCWASCTLSPIRHPSGRYRSVTVVSKQCVKKGSSERY